jgi:hypothetical protein
VFFYFATTDGKESGTSPTSSPEYHIIIQKEKEPPKLLIFSVGGYQIEISKFIKVRTNGGTKKFYLKGIAYRGGFHFVSQIVGKDNTVVS